MTKNIFALVLYGLTATTGWAGMPPIQKLQELPTTWTGVAGDLFTKSSAALVINKIHSEIREVGTEGFSALYDVSAELHFGARVLAIRKIELSGSEMSKNVLWLNFELQDELVSRLYAAITYDEASKIYFLKEMPRQNGERRFFFSAKTVP
ncbi:hypothetical protein K2X30_09740 [bacterium]|jgi:hypothetical protein|nr:hypothetical protein [bacterium]